MHDIDYVMLSSVSLTTITTQQISDKTVSRIFVFLRTQLGYILYAYQITKTHIYIIIGGTIRILKYLKRVNCFVNKPPIQTLTCR